MKNIFLLKCKEKNAPCNISEGECTTFLLMEVSIYMYIRVYMLRDNSSVVTTHGNASIFSLLTTMVYHNSFQVATDYLFTKLPYKLGCSNIIRV